jgi:membrane protease subunit (stomatin/prohibitin family)
MDMDEEERKRIREECNRMAEGENLPSGLNEINMMAVYAGPAQMENIGSMMMVYAGPAQMNGGNDAYNGMNMILAQQQSYAKKEKNEEKKLTGVYCLCPDCGYRTKPYKFCPECGGALKDVVLYRDCPACGNRVPAKDRFCRECGKALGEDESN